MNRSVAHLLRDVLQKAFPKATITIFKRGWFFGPVYSIKLVAGELSVVAHDEDGVYWIIGIANVTREHDSLGVVVKRSDGGLMTPVK